jgi:hypothetical protein
MHNALENRIRLDGKIIQRTDYTRHNASETKIKVGEKIIRSTELIYFMGTHVTIVKYKVLPSCEARGVVLPDGLSIKRPNINNSFRPSDNVISTDNDGIR